MEVESSEDPSPMDVDSANLDSGDEDARPDASDAYVQAEGPPPRPQSPYDAVSFRHVDDEAMVVSNWALEHIESLEGKIKQMTENEAALRAELRVLRGLHDEHTDTIGRLNRDLLQYQGTDPNGATLYARHP